MSENTPTQGNGSVFRSNASKCKTSWKIFAKKYEKKNEVLNNLASKYNLLMKLKNKIGPLKQYLSGDQKHLLLEMLERPDMTYTNPGKKVNVISEK